MDIVQPIKGQEVNPANQFIVGLSWDEMPNTQIDLDLQCIQLNELGQIEDAVYYNQLESKISKIKLNDDSQGEKTGFDETLTMDLNSCPFQVKYLVFLICSYKEQPLSYVESSQFQILQNNQVIFETSIGAFGKGESLSILPCIFEKSYDGKWHLFRIEEVGNGKTFLHNEQLIKKGLIKIGFDQILFQECKNWRGEKSFVMKKNVSLIIPESLGTVQVGLGWDSRCDIDSSILCFDGNKDCKENIYFCNKSSEDGSIIHHGDNVRGDGSEGDDEVISIELRKVQENIKSIWAVITIYSDSNQFDDVKGAYCRLFCEETNKEFCRYNLSNNEDGVSNGNIMCCLTRCQEGTWCFSPKGFYTQNTQTSIQVEPIIKEIMNNNYSNVETIECDDDSVEEAKEQPPEEKYCPTTQEFKIEIISAQNLAAFDSNGFSDPYVSIRINGKKICSTPIIKKNLNPFWNFSKYIYLSIGDRLELRIFDHDNMTFDDYMGSVVNQITKENLINCSTQFNSNIKDKNDQQNKKYTGILNWKITKVDD